MVVSLVMDIIYPICKENIFNSNRVRLSINQEQELRQHHAIQFHNEERTTE